MVASGRFGGPGRAAGTGPNSYALNLAIAFFVAYFGVLRRHTMTALLLSPLFLYGIFATASRTGLIALVATPLLALLVPRLAPRLGLRILPLYVLGAAAIVVIVLAIPSVGERTLERYTTLSQYQSEETWNGRWANWQGALKVIDSHRILGVGAGNYAEAALDYSPTVQEHSAAKAAEEEGLAGAAHNTFLGVASQLGLVGLILFLGILFFAFTTAWLIAQTSDLGTGIFLGLMVALIGGMALSWEDQKIVFILFGSVLALQLHDSARRAPSLDKPEGPC
jgi:putative inorganic carbon (HCO3(-)) transporter